MNQNTPNVNQQQQVLVIGGNVQNGIPQAQDDPALVINDGYLPNGDLTLNSNISYIDSSVHSVSIPFVQMASLFEQKFDSTEMNFADTEDLTFLTKQYSPPPHYQMPNIARYIANIIIGLELDIKYLESILICCANYLNGQAEILPSGIFRTLNVVRDGTNRRYSKLCKAIYYSIGSSYYQVRPNQAVIIKDMQTLLQDLYRDGTYTSVLTTLKPYVQDNQQYAIGKTSVQRWATSIPWHALIYNSQSPITFEDFLDLFFKIYSINKGKILRFDLTYPNRQLAQSIIPNSNLFNKLVPEGMNSSEIHLTSDVPNRFILFLRYLMQSELSDLPWGEDDDELDDDDIIDENEGELNNNGSETTESVDEAELAY